VTDRVPPGVTIDGIAVGGLTPAQAERLVIARARPASGTVTIERPGQPDSRCTCAWTSWRPSRAPSRGDPGDAPAVLWDRVLREVGLGSDRKVPLEHRVKGAALNRLIARLDRRLARPARDAAVRVDEGTITVVPSRDGRRVRVTRLRALLSRLPQRLTVPVAPVPPAIGDAAARAARNRAVRTPGPGARRGAGLRAHHPARTWWGLRFTPDDDAIAVGLDSSAGPVLTDTFGDLEREPVSAIPGRRGRVEWCRDARGARSTPGGRARIARGADPSGAVRVRSVARRYTAAARRMRIREVVAQFTTPYAC